MIMHCRVFLPLQRRQDRVYCLHLPAQQAPNLRHSLTCIYDPEKESLPLCSDSLLTLESQDIDSKQVLRSVD